MGPCGRSEGLYEWLGWLSAVCVTPACLAAGRLSLT